MYTTKEAMISYEHDNEIQTTIFYIDLRAAGKGFRKYIQRGYDDYAIKYVKGQVAQILQDDQKNPIVVYEDIDTFDEYDSEKRRSKIVRNFRNKT
jgi:heterodisulfide reductase subunit A